MSVLSDRDIRAELESGRVVIRPYDSHDLQPSSVDLHLDRSFRVFRNNRYPYIDVRAPQPDLTEPSRLQRLQWETGLLGFPASGHPLELSIVANLPIALYRGMRIGQISFFRMSSPVERPYGSPELGSKYQGQSEPTASAFHRDFDAGRKTGEPSRN